MGAVCGQPSGAAWGNHSVIFLLFLNHALSVCSESLVLKTVIVAIWMTTSLGKTVKKSLALTVIQLHVLQRKNSPMHTVWWNVTASSVTKLNPAAVTSSFIVVNLHLGSANASSSYLLPSLIFPHPSPHPSFKPSFAVPDCDSLTHLFLMNQTENECGKRTMANTNHNPLTLLFCLF